MIFYRIGMSEKAFFSLFSTFFWGEEGKKIKIRRNATLTKEALRNKLTVLHSVYCLPRVVGRKIYSVNCLRCVLTM
jgi:hypothetical protein